MAIAPYSRQAVTRLTEELQDIWAKNWGSSSEYKYQCIHRSGQLIDDLERIGPAAKDALPILREIETSKREELKENTLIGRHNASQILFRDLVRAAIKSIEDGTPKPKPDPLPEEARP